MGRGGLAVRIGNRGLSVGLWSQSLGRTAFSGMKAG
jgi:hypothetical protein